ncbi:MAG: hypothetical protein V4611_03065 [Patescibacteria group bacterium]
METPYPKRNELPSQERVIVAEFDTEIHASTRVLQNLSEIAEKLFESDQLYDQPTYLGDYVYELDPSPLGSDVLPGAIEPFKAGAYKSTQGLVQSQKSRDTAVNDMPELTSSLFKPVRDFTDARIVKQGNLPGQPWYDASLPEAKDYHSIEIEGLDEPLVSLLDYGINCRSYYSRPNRVTGEAVPGVKPDVFVRESIAKRLVVLNNLLQHPEVIKFFGNEVELYVDEGYRDPEVQRYLHDDYIPKLITGQLAKKHGINLETASKHELAKLEKEMIPIRDRKISKPPAGFGEGDPGPHQTGSAVDMTIRYKQDTTDLVPGVNIWFGKGAADLVKVTEPDHFEHHLPNTPEELVAQQNLRAWHYLLEVVGLRQNPTEFWHAGGGDQLSAVLDGDIDDVIALFGWPIENPNTYTPISDNEVKA